ncbi:sulfatase [Persicobacter diffluens]|uniref:Heparan N-sulfatase n=1 Tax=Persicobacter diffluens TaxID=981 RepID=A0AAN5AMG5_9BACT|nr:heparan N-sulfatase [Persicobacter diffluens]
MRAILILILSYIIPFYGAAQGNQRPNIVFCLADDWGWPHAGAYGDQGVKTPHFDRVADQGVLFHHAYVTSPSCTPSRNSFLTGKYQWELGSGGNLWSNLPVEQESFIHMLVDQGYVAGRSVEKTYGPGGLEDWIAAHGAHPAFDAYGSFEDFLAQEKQADKPFFYWLGTSDPHRPYDLNAGRESGIEVSKVHLFDHFPQVDFIRNDVADYYYEVQRWDTLVGNMIQTLEREQLLENTIIIISGDHGMPFPRGKGNLYDAGTRVPLAIMWPEGIPAGHQIDDFVSFADIAPTLLKAAGQEVPDQMTGRSFLDLLQAGKSGRLDAENREDIVFGRERHVPAQERPNKGGYPSRGLRTADFLYIRNYEPDRWPAGTFKMNATNFEGQWYADCDAGPTKTYIVANRETDEEHQRAYQLCFAKRPAEELYDLRKDPGQLHNVAAVSQYQAQLKVMRASLEKRLKALNDPRAVDPDIKIFDEYPYLGSGGAVLPMN